MTDPIAPEPTPAPLPPAAPAYAPVAVGQKTNTLAIVALILGIVVPIGGIIVGPIALGQIKRTGEGGRGLALAGLIIGIVITAIYVISFVLIGIAAAAVSTLPTYN
jgi:hypothetical protein